MSNTGAEVFEEEPEESVDSMLQGWDSWDVEESAAGPQGVFFTPEVASSPSSPNTAPQELTPNALSALSGDALLSGAGDFATPEERAQTRFEQLSTAFSTTLLVVAQMYRDEDWRYLRKDDGTAYKSLVEVCQVAMGRSAAMARRYVQGARDFYLPLSEVMVEGTRLEITSGDIASLGADGIRDAVDNAKARLDGVNDPGEASSIINDSVRSAREARDAPSESASGDGYGGDPATEGREYHEAPEGDAYGPVYTGVEDDDPMPTPPAPSGGSWGRDDDDIIGPLLVGAPLFEDTEESLADLPTNIRRVVQAMLVLEHADVAAFAQALDYSNRGVIVHGDAAQKTLARVRSIAETQPWVMERLGDSV